MQADRALLQWHTDVNDEIKTIRQCLHVHARRLWHFASSSPTPNIKRDEEFRQVFKPIARVQELRAELQQATKGTTGRLTTIEELIALPDDILRNVLAICNLLLAGECPALLNAVT